MDICNWVGGLPLAIVTVAAYCKCSRATTAEIFSSLQRSSNIWASSGELGVRNYEKTLATVFDLALSQISPDSRRFLYVLAFLSSQGIPERLLKYPHKIASLRFLNDIDQLVDLSSSALFLTNCSTELTSTAYHTGILKYGTT